MANPSFEALVELRRLLYERVLSLPDVIRDKLSDIWSPFRSDLDNLDVAIFALASSVAQSNTSPTSDKVAEVYDLLSACASLVIKACHQHGLALARQLKNKPMLRRVEGAHKRELDDFSEHLTYVRDRLQVVEERRVTFYEDVRTLIETVFLELRKRLQQIEMIFAHYLSSYPMVGSGSAERQRVFRRAEIFILIAAACTAASQIYACTCSLH